ncbi:DUF4132 domain-containing protein [Catenulispora pinisilvae]|uniref:DUF4132 domain-containing protein n=1 Tax=Catenulispora pinisilvae TaxID=2705253 RepID=UPI001891D335|nr:DUF4132 domain-containing protein [Catenulispora pinisilvae]
MSTRSAAASSSRKPSKPSRPRKSDEDALILPAAWKERRHKRRGDAAVVGAHEPSPRAMLSSQALAEVERVLRDPGSDPELAERALAHLHGAPDAVGAAVIAAVKVHRSVGGVAWPFADGWVAEHGLPFAVCAYAEFGSATVDSSPGTGGLRVVPVPRYGHHTRAWWRDEYASRRLRTRMAAADDEVYAEAVERLAGCRRDSAQRAVVSYLVPDRRDWVDECCAAPPQDPIRWMPLLALTSADQLAALRDWIPARWWDYPSGVVATMVDGLGAAMAPLLIDALDQDLSVPETRTMLNALALLPSDGAFQALVDRVGRKYVQPALLGAMKRFPVRATRLLAPATSGSTQAAVLARDLLAGHLLAAPQRAAALPELAPEVRAVIASLTATNTRIPDAPADALPPMLVDPDELLPDRIPTIGRWARSGPLPQIRLRDRDQALPREATDHLLTMLAISSPRAMCPGIGAVREACDPESLAEFSWTLFRGWQADGSPARDDWALTQLGWFGDDETVRRLAPLLRAWPGEGRTAKAVKGLDVLGEIGTDVALMHLNGIAQKIRYPALKARAQERIGDVAARLGLTPERLADRLVPDFGLDPDGTLVLDYGTRRFVAGFDEHLRPYVTDEHGRQRKTLPKPGAKDDPERAEAAYQRFAGLRKDVRMIADDQIRRLETAMAARRRWTLTEFQDLFVAHPLTWHITRRLVWIAEDDGAASGRDRDDAAAECMTAFRIAEDRSLADLADDPLKLPETATIHLAHPVDLGPDLPAWSELFADYEILQPFLQLGRPIYTLTEDERKHGRAERFEGRTMPIRGVLRLIRRGWLRGEPQHRSSLTRWISRDLAAGCQLVVGLDPGIEAGNGIDDPDQQITHARFDDSRPDHSDTPCDSLDPAIVSEALAELTDAFEETPTNG